MDTLQKKVTYIFLATVLVRILFDAFTGFRFDDAFITFRYAENLVLGKGFVYNEGERVLGTTTPLFTLVLSFLRLFGIAVVNAAMMLSLLCSGLTAVVLYHFARSLRFTHFAIVPVVLYVLFPRVVLTDISGMETAFFSLFIISGLYYQHKSKAYYALGLATLASVTRPEGLLLLVLLFIWAVYKEPREFGKLLSIPMMIILPWVLFATYYFGSPIPNSMSAKLALYSQFGATTFWDNLSLVMSFDNYYGYGMLLLAIIGGYWLYKKQNFGFIPILWMLGMIVPLAMGKTLIFLWYISPIYPVYFLFIGASFPFLAEWFCIESRKMVSCRNIAVCVVIVLLLVMLIPKAQFFAYNQKVNENVHKQVGLYLYTHASEDDVIAAEDIGYMGYFSKRYILDRDGLVSPQIIPYNRMANYYGVVWDYKPDYVVAASSSEISDEMLLDLRFFETYSIE
ncbi:MAG: hypothetical protein DWP97_00450, partial [Calditrichaeota bacterium]